jgi:hypothetical protein
MAGIKISALPAVGTAALTDIFPVVQGGITKKETLAQLATLFNSGTVLTGFLPIAGGTMTGPLILSGDPTMPLGAATKQYVDTVTSGFTVILAVQAATTANLNATQAGAGIGATLTNAGAMAAFSVDGYSANLNDRILVKDQTLTQHNGIYTVTTVGSGAVNWVLTRATDYDEPSEIFPGTLVSINNGTVNAGSSWLETATVVTVDTDPILFSQFTFGPSSFLIKANNLSDLPSVATALINLGLGTPTGTGNVVLQTSPTLITPILGDATATSLTFSPTTSGIIGTTTNDSAIAGVVGEIISSTVAFGSAVSLTNGINKDITSITLSAGDWDVWGNITFGNTLLTVAQSGWINNVSAVSPGTELTAYFDFSTGVQFNMGMAVPSRRFTVAGPTTIFLSALTVFTSGTAKAAGAIFARRRR